MVLFCSSTFFLNIVVYCCFFLSFWRFHLFFRDFKRHLPKMAAFSLFFLSFSSEHVPEMAGSPRDVSHRIPLRSPEETESSEFAFHPLPGFPGEKGEGVQFFFFFFAGLRILKGSSVSKKN